MELSSRTTLRTCLSWQTCALKAALKDGDCWRSWVAGCAVVGWRAVPSWGERLCHRGWTAVPSWGGRLCHRGVDSCAVVGWTAVPSTRSTTVSIIAKQASKQSKASKHWTHGRQAVHPTIHGREKGAPDCRRLFYLPLPGDVPATQPVLRRRAAPAPGRCRR